VAGAQHSGIVGLLLDDDVLLRWVVVIVVLIGREILDMVGLPRLVAAEGRSPTGGVLPAEEVILELLIIVLVLQAPRLGEVANTAEYLRH
jgi:hypothetical protein